MVNTVFIDESMDRMNGDHNYGFLKVVSGFFNDVGTYDINIYEVGYNDEHRNYYIAFDNGICYYFNADTEKTGFLISDPETGEEFVYKTWDEAVESF